MYRSTSSHTHKNSFENKSDHTYPSKLFTVMLTSIYAYIRCMQNLGVIFR